MRAARRFWSVEREDQKGFAIVRIDFIWELPNENAVHELVRHVLLIRTIAMQRICGFGEMPPEDRWSTINVLLKAH
jgi:hypothetical protein